MECCVIVVAAVIIGFIGWRMLEVQAYQQSEEKKRKEREREELKKLEQLARREQEEIDQKRIREQVRINQSEERFKRKENEFLKLRAAFWSTDQFCSYHEVVISMKKLLNDARNNARNNALNMGEKIHRLDEYQKYVEQFKSFCEKNYSEVGESVFATESYGVINKDFMNHIRGYQAESVKFCVSWGKEKLNTLDYDNIWKLSSRTLLQAVWFYAMQKPYSVYNFENASKVFYQIYKTKHIDVFLAEAYAMKQMGGDRVLEEKLSQLLENKNGRYHVLDSYCKDKTDMKEKSTVLTNLASGLMWMKAFKEEHTVLQFMLSNNIPMSGKLQERLHSLSNGGENAPSDYDVKTAGSQIYLDVAALAWRDQDYNSFFENLSFKEKSLTYSLAVRAEDKNLFIAQAVNLPENDKIARKISAVFEEEYGTSVTADTVEGVVLSGDGSESLSGILAKAKDCRQLGIFVHIARIGKKLSIKFYTLYVPEAKEPEAQKQQVMSLYKKLSPTVTMWEDSLKDTILMSIQQMLNAVPMKEEPAKKEGPSSAKDIAF